MQHPQVVTDSRFQVNHSLHFSWRKTFFELVFKLLSSVSKLPVYLVEIQLYKIPCKRVNRQWTPSDSKWLTRAPSTVETGHAKTKILNFNHRNEILITIKCKNTYKFVFHIANRV